MLDSRSVMTYLLTRLFLAGSLVDDVLGHNAGDKVPMEKVVMLLWSFRDDPSVVKFMAQFVSKVGGVAVGLLAYWHICMN